MQKRWKLAALLLISSFFILHSAFAPVGGGPVIIPGGGISSNTVYNMIITYGGSGSVTNLSPWTTDINAAGFALTNVGRINVGGVTASGSGTITTTNAITGTNVLAGNQFFYIGPGTNWFKDGIGTLDDAYDATAWNGSIGVPTKNAIRDALQAGTGAVTNYWDINADNSLTNKLNRGVYLGNFLSVNADFYGSNNVYGHLKYPEQGSFPPTTNLIVFGDSWPGGSGATSNYVQYFLTYYDEDKFLLHTNNFVGGRKLFTMFNPDYTNMIQFMVATSAAPLVLIHAFLNDMGAASNAALCEINMSNLIFNIKRDATGERIAIATHPPASGAVTNIHTAAGNIESERILFNNIIRTKAVRDWGADYVFDIDKGLPFVTYYYQTDGTHSSDLGNARMGYLLAETLKGGRYNPNGTPVTPAAPHGFFTEQFPAHPGLSANIYARSVSPGFMLVQADSGGGAIDEYIWLGYAGEGLFLQYTADGNVAKETWYYQHNLINARTNVALQGGIGHATNGVNTGALYSGAVFQTNVAGNIVLGGYTIPNSTHEWRYHLAVTNGSGGDTTVTFANGSIGSGQAALPEPPVFHCTNNSWTYFTVKVLQGLYTNVSKENF